MGIPPYSEDTHRRYSAQLWLVAIFITLRHTVLFMKNVYKEYFLVPDTTNAVYGSHFSL